MTDRQPHVGDRVASTIAPVTGSIERVVATTTGSLAVVRADDGRKFTGYVGLSLEREGGDE